MHLWWLMPGQMRQYKQGSTLIPTPTFSPSPNFQIISSYELLYEKCMI